MDKIIVIKNQDDAKNYLINKVKPTDLSNRVGQAIGLGLLGGTLGAGFSKVRREPIKKGVLIGGALGALGGLITKPSLTEGDNERVARGVLSGLKKYYVIASLPSGQVFLESYSNVNEAKGIANKLKEAGHKSFVVTPEEFNKGVENRQFGFLDSFRGTSSDRDFKSGIIEYGKTNKKFMDSVDLNKLPKDAQDALKKDALTAGQNKVIGEKRALGQSIGAIGGIAAGGGLGYLLGKKIAGLKSEEAYIKEYLAKHPNAKELDAKEAYKQRLAKFMKAGANVGMAAGGALGTQIGDRYGRKAGIKDARQLSNELMKRGK